MLLLLILMPPPPLLLIHSRYIPVDISGKNFVFVAVAVRTYAQVCGFAKFFQISCFSYQAIGVYIPFNIASKL